LLQARNVSKSYPTPRGPLSILSEVTLSIEQGEALSIVIHDPAGASPAPKMACADLLPDDGAAVEATGTVAPFAAAEAIDQNIAGSVTMMRDGSGTHVQLSLTGLDPAAVYGAHIHALPCGATDAAGPGGGHYKMDPTVVDPLETNELWPQVVSGTVCLSAAQLSK